MRYQANNNLTYSYEPPLVSRYSLKRVRVLKETTYAGEEKQLFFCLRNQLSVPFEINKRLPPVVVFSAPLSTAQRTRTKLSE